jgi:prepilin-type N-terminal cleavage/methylation domain-containing protein
MQRNKKTGFTLIELLLVVTMIGILATVAVAALGESRRKTRDLKRNNEVRTLHHNLEIYGNEKDGYPRADTPIVLGGASAKMLCDGGFKAQCEAGEKVFEPLISSAPEPADGDCSQEQNQYTYVAPEGGEYRIDFCLGKAVGDLLGGVHSATPNGVK